MAKTEEKYKMENVKVIKPEITKKNAQNTENY